MRASITNRVIQLADHVIATGDTVRGAAQKFGISKSTVHKDLSERLYYADRKRYAVVRKILDKNLSERHIRGGIATRLKYRLKKQRARGK